MISTRYTRIAVLAATCCLGDCTYHEIPTGFDCAKSDLQISLVSKVDATTCKSIDGQITMSAAGGVPPYDFSLGDGVYQTNPVFDRLAPGSYLVTVKDTKLCKSVFQVDLGAATSNLSASATATKDDQCFSDNGSVIVTPGGGDPPYRIKIDDGTFGSVNTFSNLKNGNHTVIVRDFNDCERVLIVPVERGNTNISYKSIISPIFAANCNFNGCHGSGSTGRDWTNFSDVKNKASDIKARTSNRSMPIGAFTLTTQEIQQIACWVDDGANNN